MLIRHRWILDLVNERERVAVTELARIVKVSEVTMRKDLNALAARGLLRREHGYAVITASDDVANHLSFNYETKHSIALEAAKLVRDGETVMIESGSCCTLLAEELAMNRNGLTIVTNSTFIADFIRRHAETHLVLLGGDYQPESQVLVGKMIANCVRDFAVDKLFIGIDGFDQRGFLGNNLQRVEAIRTMSRRARRVIVLAESAKFTRDGLVPLFPKHRVVDAVYTDEDLAATPQKLLREAEVAVHTVPVVR